MEPTLEPGDRLAATINFDPSAIRRGDIVVLNEPPTDSTPGVTNVIDRIVGRPGETISASRGEIYIDGQPLDESWLPPVDRSTTSTFGPTQIPQNYFVMGDNRADLADSRVYGPIPSEVIIGVVVEITSPSSRARSLTP
jgi:signal peptidase I